MKREWKLIRALLLGEDTSGYSDDVITNHWRIMADRGWAELSDEVVGPLHKRVTWAGVEAGISLLDLNALEQALATLRRHSAGESEEMVMLFVRENTQSKPLIKQPS